MSIEIKQKIKEVADDFGMPAKNLIEIVGKFYDKPKSSSQNLTEEQLNVIFDYITAQNQIGSIAEVFAAAKPKDEPKPAAPAPAPQQSQPVQSQQPAPRPQQNQPRPQGSFNNNNNRPAQQQNQRPQFNQRPQPQNQQPRPQQSQPQQQGKELPTEDQQQPAQQQAKQPQPERKRERRVIDTSAVTVNADRYDDRVDSLVSERVQNYSSGKQKIGNKNKKQQAKKFGTKNRSEEQEKMRRLQLEIAKKAPLVVKIPDEITVGELAARLKATATDVIKKLMGLGVMATINEVIDFDFTNKETIVSAEKKWDADTSDPLGDLERWREAVQKEGFVNCNICIMAKDVANAFVNNAKVKSVLDVRAYDLAVIKPRELPNGLTYIGTIHKLGLDIYQYNEWYLDNWTNPNAPTQKPLVPDGTLALLSTEAEYSIYYGAITMIPEEGKTFVTVEGDRVPQTWVERRPDRRFLQVNSKPLTVPHEVNSWYVAKVL